MITGYIGPNGSGKTVSAVTDAIHWADRLDRPLFSALPIEWTPRRAKEPRSSLPIRDLDHLLDLEDCEILLDEVVSVLSSRETAVIPPKMVLALNTFRHRDVGVYWTAPAWNRADVLLREVTADIHMFTPLIRRTAPNQRWYQTVYSKRQTFDGTDNASSRLPRDRRGLPRIVRIRGLRGFGCYATRNPDLEKIQGSGKYCSTCGGKRTITVEPCKCA